MYNIYCLRNKWTGTAVAIGQVIEIRPKILQVPIRYFIWGYIAPKRPQQFSRKVFKKHLILS